MELPILDSDDDDIADDQDNCPQAISKMSKDDYSHSKFFTHHL